MPVHTKRTLQHAKLTALHHAAMQPAHTMKPFGPVRATALPNVGTTNALTMNLPMIVLRIAQLLVAMGYALILRDQLRVLTTALQSAVTALAPTTKLLLRVHGIVPPFVVMSRAHTRRSRPLAPRIARQIAAMERARTMNTLAPAPPIAHRGAAMIFARTKSRRRHANQTARPFAAMTIAPMTRTRPHAELTARLVVAMVTAPTTRRPQLAHATVPQSAVTDHVRMTSLLRSAPTTAPHLAAMIHAPMTNHQ